MITVNEVPRHCGDGEILLLTADCGVFLEQGNTPEELTRAADLEHHSARRYLGARRLLRNVLSGLTDCLPAELEIKTDETGKPYLTGHRYHFSIAHSREVVGVAVAGFSVGLDLEWARPVDEAGLSRRFFSTEEAALFCSEPNAEQFFTLWTCREAAIKADGRGLAQLLSMTRVSTDPMPRAGLREVVIGENEWKAAHWMEGNGLHGAVAFRGLPPAISWCDLRGKAIL